MNGIPLKKKLQSDAPVFGTVFNLVTTPSVVDVLPAKGLDFVIAMTEHTALNLSDFLPLRWALAGTGIACLARVDSHDPMVISKACDGFSDGVVVPYVEDVTHLKRMIAAAKCRPLAGAAREHLITSGEWPSDKTKAYVEAKCAETVFVAMIESVTAIENLDAICSVSGLDAIFVGPNDLTMTMGIPEERDSREFVDTLQHVIDTAQKHGVAAGAHFSKIEHGKRLVQQGARFIPYSSDMRLIQHGIPAWLTALRGEAHFGSERIL